MYVHIIISTQVLHMENVDRVDPFPLDYFLIGKKLN